MCRIKITLICLFVFLGANSFAQSWQQNSQKIRFNNGLGVPVKVPVTLSLSDSSQIAISPLDSNIYYRRLSSWIGIMRYIDTAAMLNNYRTSINSLISNTSGISGKLNISDTAAMLAALHASIFSLVLDTLTIQPRFNNTNAVVGNKLNKSDTASMLSPYAKYFQIPNVSGKLNISDTASMLYAYLYNINYLYNNKIGIGDTSTMLSHYYNKTASDARYQPLENQRLSTTNNVSFNTPNLGLNSRGLTVGKDIFIDGTGIGQVAQQYIESNVLSDSAGNGLWYQTNNFPSPSKGYALNLNTSGDFEEWGYVNYTGAYNWYRNFRITPQGYVYAQRIRSRVTPQTLYYDTATKEIVYGGAIGISDSGKTYTPTVFSSTGTSTTSIPTAFTYLRVGNSCTVSGIVGFTASSTSGTINITLPFATSASASLIIGNSNTNVINNSDYLTGDGASPQHAQINFHGTTSTVSYQSYIHFTYTIQ